MGSHCVSSCILDFSSVCYQPPPYYRPNLLKCALFSIGFGAEHIFETPNKRVKRPTNGKKKRLNVVQADCSHPINLSNKISVTMTKTCRQGTERTVGGFEAPASRKHKMFWKLPLVLRFLRLSKASKLAIVLAFGLYLYFLAQHHSSSRVLCSRLRFFSSVSSVFYHLMLLKYNIFKRRNWPFFFYWRGRYLWLKKSFISLPTLISKLSFR